MAPGEAELVDSLRRGDEATFRIVVNKYHSGLVRVARGYVPSAAVAEEVVQDTWLAVIKGLDSFEGRSSFKSWLFRILINKAQTRGAREARSVPVDFSLGVDDYSTDLTHHSSGNRNVRFHWRTHPNAWSELPEALFDEQETRTKVEQSIEDLPAAQRLVITMRGLEGLEPAEVCDLLGISEANQRVLLHRARTQVRAKLDSHFSTSVKA